MAATAAGSPAAGGTGAADGLGLVELVHTVVPGRARVAVRRLRHDPDLARRVERWLTDQPGIRHVRAGPRTGRLLVQFDPAHGLETVRRAVVEAVAQAGAAVPGIGNPHSGNPHSGNPHADNPGHAGAADDPPADSAAAGRGPSGSSSGGPPWHVHPADHVVERLQSSLEQGLTAEEARRRLERYGANELTRAAGRSPLSIAVDQVRSLPVGLLIGSAVLSVVTGGIVDAVAIICVVGLNAAIGFVTENRAERTVSSLLDVPHPDVPVWRDSGTVPVAARDIVPGDILMANPGMLVPADARLIEVRDLSVDESALTGESIPVDKATGRLDRVDAPLGERRNMLFRGTAVTAGSARAVVVGTGPHTEIGRIQALAGTARPPETPIQSQLDRLGRELFWVSFGICGLQFALGLARGAPPMVMLKTAVSLAVAAIPEGLPTVATLTLALGIRDMRKRNVVVRRLDAVETLGSLRVICFDKTGTLTQNRMTAVAAEAAGDSFEWQDDELLLHGRPVEPDEHPALLDLLRVCVLCNETELPARAGDGHEDIEGLTGSATETALVALAIRAGLRARGERDRFPLSDTEQRTAERQYMITHHEMPEGGRLVAVKGNPVQVLGLCRRYWEHGETRELTVDERGRLVAANDRLSGRGLRVLGFAIGRGEAEEAKIGLTWLGVVGLADPLRPGMTELMRTMHGAGVRTAMITGDQANTAYAIASQLDLSAGGSVEILEGPELEQTDPETLAALAKATHVYARVSPANKLEIVQALQRTGQVVAMTGDGINDSPALRAADIGVAMGSGSEAAHEVADIILQDDRIETVATALRQGRTVYRNIRKSIHFLLATNFSEIMVTFAATGIGTGWSLTPLQLLWINLVTDVFPALGLALEPPDRDVLKQKPLKLDEPILHRRDFARMGREASFISLGALASFLYGAARYGPGPGSAGLAFTTLISAQLLHAETSRSNEISVFDREKLPRNPSLRRAEAALLGLQALVSVLPPSRRLLGLDTVRLLDLAVAGALALGPYAVNERMKTLFPPPPRPEDPQDEPGATAAGTADSGSAAA